MGSKAVEAMLAAQSAQMQQIMLQQLAMNKPGEVELGDIADQEEWRSFMRSGDFSHAPGVFTPGAFSAAQLNKLRSRSGTGAQQLGSHGANSTALALAREQNDMQAADTNAAAYADAIHEKDAAMRAARAGLEHLDVSRKATNLGATTSAANNSQNAYISYLMRPKEPSFLRQLALAGIGAAGSFLGGLGAKSGSSSSGSRASLTLPHEALHLNGTL